MLRPDTLALTSLLALLTALGPMSVDFYLPSLPGIGRAFQAEAHWVQLTLSGYLLGFALGQALYGAVSDQVGRKPVLMVALVLYAVASLGCLSAGSIEMLVAWRCLQGLGVAGAPVLARSIVRDLYHGARAGRELARMSAIMALAPILAPTLGGVLQESFGWRPAFVGMAFTGLAAVMLVRYLLPETMPRRPGRTLSAAGVLGNYGGLLRHRGYRRHLAISAASYGGLFAWMSGSSFVLQDLYGLSPLQFGMMFACSTLGWAAGTSLAAQVVGRLGIERTIRCGAFALAAGGLAMVAAVLSGLASPFALVLPAAVYSAVSASSCRSRWRRR